MTVVAAIALSDGDSAAATIAATMKPARPWVSELTTKTGRISSFRVERLRQRRLLVIDEQHHADQQEHDELREDDEAAQDEAARGFARAARRQQTLHQKLIGAVRRQRQRDAAEEAGPQRIGPAAVERRDREPRTCRGCPPGVDDRRTSRRKCRSSRDHATAAAPAMYTNIWTTSVQITADTPPRTVYTIIAAPSTITTQGTGTPVTTAMTSAVANSRMPSASDRVIRKMPADKCLHPVPKRRCSSSYEVNRSPRK